MSEREERKRRKQKARRTELLDAAMEIVAQQGLGALTIARLAKHAGVAVGVMYRYFENKQALLSALQLRALEEFTSDFQGALQEMEDFLRDQGREPTQDPVATLARIYAASHFYLYDTYQAPTRFKMMDATLSVMEPFMPDELARDIAQTVQQLLSLIECRFLDAALCGALSSGAPESAWQRTYILWAQLHGLTHFHKRDRLLPDYLHVSALFRESLRTMFLGWGATAEIIDDAEALFASSLGRAS